MRPKARGWPAWLAGGEWPGRCDFVRDGRAVLFRTVPAALTGAAQLRADGIPSCCYSKCTHYYTTIRHEPRQARKAWPGTLVDPCNACMPSLWLDLILHSARLHPLLGEISCTTRLDYIPCSIPCSRLDLIHHSARLHPLLHPLLG